MEVSGRVVGVIEAKQTVVGGGTPGKTRAGWMYKSWGKNPVS